MQIYTGVALALVACGLNAAGADDQEDEFRPIDISRHVNVLFTENVGNTGNTLERLPVGNRKLEGIPFRIEKGTIQLGSLRVTQAPRRVAGIKIGEPFRKLHVLHATHVTVEDGTVLGWYVVNYDDGSRGEIPIVYGIDVRDWWYFPDTPPPGRARVAWTGTNPDAAKDGARIRLYLSTLKNPEPAKRAVSLDYVSSWTTEAAPFCVAITAEE